MATCQGTILKGNPCRNPAKKGTRYSQHHTPQETDDPLEIYKRKQATPVERTEIVLALLEVHPWVVAFSVPVNALLLGLICLEPGQVQAVHSHQGQDKFYFVLEGAGHFTVGDDISEAGPGHVVWAAADMPHGVENKGTDLLCFFVRFAFVDAPRSFLLRLHPFTKYGLRTTAALNQR
jgi:mannose-6-phosphate isomerase-like protein (cupin superfamily)